MKNTLWKDIFRDINKSKGRFFSIVIIIALGVMLFTGVKTAPINMKVTSDKYYDDYNLMDLRVISTLGLTDEDIKDIKNINGVLGVYGEKTIDVISKINSNEVVMKIQSLPENLGESNEDYINRLVVVEGHLPEADNQCVIGEDKMKKLNLKIGDKIKFTSETDIDLSTSLKHDEYEIVGIVRNPYYLSSQFGSSSIGNGTISNIVYINQSEFKMEEYTDAYVTVKDAKELDTYSDEYFKVVGKVEEDINNISKNAIDRRYEEIIKKVYLTNSLQAEGNHEIIESSIDKIEKPTWYVLDRKSHYSYVDYENSANSIDKLANVFPLFFLIVAALVCLTTMTRMVDEQRINIGTLKALGYSKWNIAKKFIVYALLASLIGSILGLIGGFTIITTIIYTAYNIMYMMPSMEFVIKIFFALAVILVSVGLTTLVTYGACRIELIESPAALMRAKAPKEGKRIILEKIPFIWNRLNFTEKVTVRNIFRYKKRFWMTVIGIACSTDLLLTGLGLKDSISTIITKQYNDIEKYQLSINLENSIDNKENIDSIIDGNNDIKSYLYIQKESCNLINDDITQGVSLIVPKDEDKLSDFIYLRSRKNKEKIILPNDGAVISEKIAKLLNVKVGDKITIKNSNDISKKIKISAISENYINHYIYMNINYYNNVFGEDANFNDILITLNDTDSKAAEEVAANLIAQDGIRGVTNNTLSKDSFEDTIKSLDFVVFIMILCAGALSFVVLYNLTNVNISERIREIATIKVLGFYDNEVASYIFRENILLTIVGLIFGLGLGVLFHRFIITTVEMEYVMFGRNIGVIGFVLASILTIVFSLIVNWAMYYKLKNVKMVESLKSVD